MVQTLAPTRATPSFLKWVGGKARYSSALIELMPNFSGTYYEPFLGSGAVFFALSPKHAVLSDANAEVVKAFQQVAENAELIMELLEGMENTKENYLNIRAQDIEDLSDLQRGARLIYLNKTCFRGLWRVNKRGQMNTPYGEYYRPLFNRETMLACQATLSNTEVIESDFEAVIERAGNGDFVYLDPPYIPLGGFADFKRYTPEQFNEPEHIRLAEAMRRATARGAYVLMTNSDTPKTREVYSGFNYDTMNTRRDINLRAHGRASSDLLVSNYDFSSHRLF